MNHLEQIKKDSIKNLGSLLNREEIEDFISGELWESEQILIDKYFSTDSKILDIGCGLGRIALFLSKKGNEVVGIDQTSEFIDIARKVGLSTNLNLGYRIGRATDINFGDNHFDFVIFANNALGSIPGRGQRILALKEIARVLKPGGRLILCVHRRYYFSKASFFWAWKFFEYYVSRVFRLDVKEVDFGDIFLSKNKNGEKLKQKRFVHILGKWEIEKAIKGAGLEIEYCEKMGKISKQDVVRERCFLSKGFNSGKSPVFYVCKKKEI